MDAWPTLGHPPSEIGLSVEGDYTVTAHLALHRTATVRRLLMRPGSLWVRRVAAGRFLEEEADGVVGSHFRAAR